MRYSDNGRNIGDKLLPKMITAVSQSVIATKRGLMPTEHKLRVDAMQTIIDRMGHEMAAQYRPLMQAMLENDDGLDPVAREFLESAMSGEDQWRAVGGILGMTGATGSISLVLSNYLAGLTQRLIELSPSLHVDERAAAQAQAQNIIPASTAEALAAQAGYDSANYGILRGLATNYPTPDILFTMFHRGYIDRNSTLTYLRNNGFPEDLIEQIFALNQQPVSVSDAALGVLRNDITLQEGRQIGYAWGYDDHMFDILMLNTGEPPGIMQLLEAYRRKFIDLNTIKRGILQSRVRDEWIDTVLKLRYSPASTADAVQAVVQGYLTSKDATDIADQNGLEPGAMNWLIKTAGEPLSRTEMTYLVNRGYATIDQYDAALRQSRLKDEYIPLARELVKRPATIGDAVRGWVQGYLTLDDRNKILGMNGLREEDYDLVSEIDGIPLSLTEVLRLHRYGEMTIPEVEQALRESRLKDKYIPYALKLGVNYPSIYDVRLMLEEGAITDKQAADILAKEGYPADLITSLVHTFSMGGSTAKKSITESMLADLYIEGGIERAEFIVALKDIGYTEASAELIAQVTDWKAELAARNSLISRTRSLFVGRKITENNAENRLRVALIPEGVIARVMQDWTAELEVNSKSLTEAQIVSAWKLGLLADNDPPVNTTNAVTRLTTLGYSSDDALLLLQIANKATSGGFFGGNPSAGT